MPSCAPQSGRRDVVQCFVAATTSSSDRIGLRQTVGGRETLAVMVGALKLQLPPHRAQSDGPPTDSEHAECRGVNVKRSSTPFLVHLAEYYIGSVSTGGNGGFGFLAKKLPYLQPIATKFGPHIPVSYTHLTLPTNREV